MPESTVQEECAQLAANSRLEDVFFRALHAELRSEPAPLHGEDMQIDLALALGRKKPAADDTQREFRVEVRFNVPHPRAKLSATAVAQYVVPAQLGDLLSDAVLTEFARDVGIPDIAPFLREAFASMTQRLGVRPFVLPFIPKDSVHL